MSTAAIGAVGAAGGAPAVGGTGGAARPAESGAFADVLRRADRAQGGLGQAIARASDGAGIGAGEMIALQAQMYRSSLELDLASKIVEKVTSGIKQTLNTNT